MSIPASDLVSITPRVLAGEGQELAFNGLFLTSNPLMPVDTIQRFFNASEVAEFFGYDSDAYKAAVVYFNGFDNSLQKPSCLFFFRHIATDTASFVRGLPSENEGELLNHLKAITNGQITINLGPSPLTLNAMDFSQCNSLSACAKVLQDAINNEGSDTNSELWLKTTVEYSSLTKAFSVFAGVKGSEIAASPFTGDVAEVMGLSLSTNAAVSVGGSARSYTETLDRAVTYTANFVSFSTVEEVTNLEDAQALANWTNAHAIDGDQFLYVYYSTDVTLAANNTDSQASAVGKARVGSARVVNAGSGQEIVKDFKANNYEGVTAVYGDLRYAAFIMGCAASISWAAPNSVISFAYKSQNGLIANVTDKATAAKLDLMGINYIGDYASRSDQFVLLQKGSMFGQFSWIDTYLNNIWLNNKLQTAIINGFEVNFRVPHTPEGYALIRAWIQTPVQAALRNGVIEPDITLSSSQIQALKAEAGQDISTSLIRNGYYFQIDEATAQTRSERESPPCRFWYTSGGAIHKISLPITAVV